MLIFNLLNIIFYLVVDYIYQFESKFIHFGIVFSVTLVFSILLLWAFKFVDASRLFLLIFYLLFYICLIITTRTKNNISDDIYVTFDKSLALSSENMIYTDEEKFPDDFLNQASNLLKNKNLKGIVFNDHLNAKFKLEDIIEISNFLGVDVVEKKKEKFNLIHKSTNINKPLKNLEDVILLIIIWHPLNNIDYSFLDSSLTISRKSLYFSNKRESEKMETTLQNL